MGKFAALTLVLILALASPTYGQVSITRAVPAGILTPTTATGTTINDLGGPGRAYKVTVASTAFVCAALTCDVTLATVPAKVKLGGVVADLTTTFACTATCVTATLTFTVGKSAGGTDYLLSADADAAAGQFGLTAGTSGADLVANLAQGGTIPSFSGTTTISVRLISAVGNIGTGTVTNLSQGSITFYILSDLLP